MCIKQSNGRKQKALDEIQIEENKEEILSVI
jgi:hypothetical protein